MIVAHNIITYFFLFAKIKMDRKGSAGNILVKYIQSIIPNMKNSVGMDITKEMNLGLNLI
jgi:hypothetical protein